MEKLRVRFLIIAVLVIIASAVALGGLMNFYFIPMFLKILIVLAAVCGLVVSGFLFIRKITSNSSKGLVLIILIIAVSLSAVIFLVLNERRSDELMMLKSARMFRLGFLGAAAHASKFAEDGNNFNNDNWCDSLSDNWPFDNILLYSKPQKGTPFPYAINPNCGKDSADDVVLVFESKPGWNLAGGPELLNFEPTERHWFWGYKIKGSFVLPKNGNIKFVKENEISNLKWR